MDDGPNAIAEARTALSIDPKNAEAYQFMGLGHYSSGQYKAAVHAYGESLALDPGNADTFYDMGIALHADGNLPSAILAYEQAIRLRPAFWEAHANLGLILHEARKSGSRRWRSIARPRRSLLEKPRFATISATRIAIRGSSTRRSKS